MMNNKIGENTSIYEDLLIIRNGFLQFIDTNEFYDALYVDFGIFDNFYLFCHKYCKSDIKPTADIAPAIDYDTINCAIKAEPVGKIASEIINLAENKKNSMGEEYLNRLKAKDDDLCKRYIKTALSNNDNIPIDKMEDYSKLVEKKRKVDAENEKIYRNYIPTIADICRYICDNSQTLSSNANYFERYQTDKLAKHPITNNIFENCSPLILFDSINLVDNRIPLKAKKKLDKLYVLIALLEKKLNQKGVNGEKWAEQLLNDGYITWGATKKERVTTKYYQYITHKRILFNEKNELLKTDPELDHIKNIVTEVFI